MKFKSKLSCLLLMVVLLLSLTAVAAEGNATQSSFKEVSTDPVSVSVESNSEILGISNSEDNLGAPDDRTFAALQKKINDTAEGGILDLENDYANTDDFDSSGIIISKSLTIDGNGYTIDALNKGRIFQVTASNVILKNINFVNGKVDTAVSHGGAVHWYGANGSLSGCNFIGNSVTIGYGGAVSWYGANGSLSGSTFINNSASRGGGAVIWRGDDGSLSGCNFTGNNASGGGAVIWGGAYGSLSDSIFINNSAYAQGGAVSWQGLDGSLSGCNFTGNNANRTGGAVDWISTGGNLTDSNFICNKAEEAGAVNWYGNYGNMSGCSFVNCTSNRSSTRNSVVNGGTVYWSGINGSLSDCSFVNCTSNSLSTDASAHVYGGVVYWSGNNGNMSGCSFVNCSASATTLTSGYYLATSSGGAIYWSGGYGNVDNCSFMNCSANIYYPNGSRTTSEDGGAIYWTGINGTLNNCSFMDCYAGDFGGAICWQHTDGKISNSSFVNCSSDYRGGTIFWNTDRGIICNSSFVNCSGRSSGAIEWNGNNCSVIDCYFENCSAVWGGAIKWGISPNRGVNGTLMDSTFVNCSADTGGAVYWSDVNNGILTNCSFFNCTANKILSPYGSRDGGAVYWASENGILTNSSFVNCSASSFGGAILWNAPGGNVSGSNFTGNNASVGGAVYWFGDRGSLSGSTFINNSADSDGGAIKWEGNDGSVSDCSFINNSAKGIYGGGAVHWYGANGSISNSSFADNSVTVPYGVSSNYNAGAILWSANGSLNNCTFVNNSANNGGAVSWYYRNGIIKDCTFIDNSATGSGGALVMSGGDNSYLFNCYFVNNSATGSGGAVHWLSKYSSVSNCSFVNNSASGAGAIMLNNDFIQVSNSSFVNNSANLGGAITHQGHYSGSSLLNCSFVNNSASVSAGAIYWLADSCSIINCSFVDNSAIFDESISYGGFTAGAGGAVYWQAKNGTFVGSSFVNNSASHYGGAIYLDSASGSVTDSSFINNFALHSGAISLRTSNLTVEASNFTSNYVTHGGGAIGNAGENPDQVNVEIKNSNFDNNHANNYGGALSLENVLVDNSNFNNNSAVFGGAIYSISPTVKNSKFKNNKALKLGNGIFAINEATIVNTNIDNNDIYENNLKSVIFDYRISGYWSGLYQINYDGNVYDAFTIESNLITPYNRWDPPLGQTNDVYMVDPSLKLVRNVVDSSDVSEYIKVLLFKYSKGELTYDEVSSMINNAVYVNPLISNDKAPEFEYLGNNVVKIYEYISLITPSSNSNFVFLKQSTHTLNYTVTKEALNKTAYVGDIVKFRINVTNGNNFTLSDVFVKDIFNDTEFEYLSFESKDNWSYDVNSKVFTLKSLSPSNTSSLILAFKVKINGTLTNIAVSGIGENETGYNNTTIKVFNPQLAVEKTCLNLNQTVILGQTAKFEIYVRNDGDIDLHNVTITENPSQGLVFDSYDENGLWEYSFVNNKHVWTLVNTLTPGSSAQLFVNFNTTALGHLVNYANVVSSETNKSTTAAHVDVIKAEFKVEKIVLTPKVALGEQVIYEIIVHNTGEADLTNIVVEEMPDASLVFDHYDDKGLFKHSVELGKHIWTLDKLAKGNYAVFILYFNTTATGNISNKISVKSDEVPEEIITSNNTTVLLPAFTLEKISLTPTVVLGQNAEFEIVIRNTGKVELTNVYFTEDSFDGLIYDSAIGEGIWTHKFENDKHTWTFNDVLEPGEIIELTLRFNTTASGEFTNFVSAGSNQTEILTANATVTVLKPEFKVEKILLTPKVALGEQVIYEIIIHNTGEADLTNIVVEEMPDASLVFDHYVDGGLFKHSVELGKHIWTLDKLNKGNYAGFRLYFNTTATGNISNKISVKSDEVPEEIITSNNTTVLLSAFSVEKICLLPNVLVGNQTQFQIVIKNTGKIQLTDVYFTEDSFNGLIYDSAIGGGIWTHKFENGKHTWTFNDVLEPGEIIGLTLIFNTTAKGNFTNFVSAGSNQTEVLTANATVHVFESKVPEPPVQNLTGMDVFKTVITQEAVLGGQITFQIVVHNTGNTNLENVKISEILPDGLVYDHFTDYLGLWRYNNDLTWSATRAILPGEYAGFFVTFNTTKAGRFENHIVVSGDNTNITPGNTSFDVLNPSFTIEKILVEDYILNGTRATFEIVIHNTGNASLSGVTVKEYGFNGLIYNNFVDNLGMWTYNGDLSWTLNAKLAPGEYAVLSVTFNTTTPGNFTNFVSGSSNETGILIANATVHVLDGTLGPEQNSSDDYKMDVFKTVITQEAVLGGQITFQIVVHNTGNKNLENVKITEILPDGLIYEYFTDYLGLWTYNGDLTWSATRAIVPGEYVGFFVTFKTTKAGRFENHVVVTSDKGNGTADNSPFEVLNPDFTIEKILVEDNIANGGQATFEIVIHNTGTASLTNLTVREYFFEGLVYNHFVDYLDLWTYNGDLSWTMNSKLLPGEYVGFFVTFNTTKDGKFTNIVVANSTECGDKFSNNATVSVHNETVDIRMVCLNPLVIVGNQVTFEITVQNTGNIPITALKLSEYDFEGLVYNHYMDYLGHWINDGITWTLNTTLVPGELTSLFVVFNTIRVGNFTNIVLANNDVLNPNDLLSANSLEDGIFVSAGVEVVKPEYTIEIVALNKTVENGEEVTFEVIVHNIGKVDVSNITVRDIPSDGLNYVGFIDNENFWSKNNDLSWDLVKVLVPGQYSSFYIVFNTTKSGILENTIVSDNLTSKASVEVNEILKPEYTIEKVALNKTAIIGDEIVYEIIIHNTGKVDISNITVRDIPSDGLEYLRFIDSESFWSKNSDLSWNLIGNLVPGQYSSFYIVFNATKAGTLENSLESDNLTSKTTVEVKDPVVPTNPGLTINVEVTTDPITGQPVLKVTVTNIGNVDLDNVFVKANLPEGLKYGNYYSYDSIWNLNNGVFDLEGLLKVGESKSFFIEILGNPGDYQIKIDAGFNGTIADIAIVSVKVLDNSTPGNVTPEVPKDNNVKKLKSSVAAGDNATGNPILMILLVLIALALTRFRKKD